MMLRIDGTASLPFAREPVWAAFTDPEVLHRATPGCESLVQVGSGRYEATMKAGVGSISGIYKGTLEIIDQQPPEHYKLVLQGKGPVGYLRGSAVFDFTSIDDCSTTVAYAWDVEVGGLVAGVGQRVLAGVGKTLIGQFIAAIRKELETRVRG